MVSHPLDKRCVVEVSDDVLNQPFCDFLKLEIPFFQLFLEDIQETIKKRSDITIVGRNEKCPCKSGKKSKNCCGKDLYYKHYHHNITLGENILFHKN